MEPIEHITWKNKPLAYIVRATIPLERTTFLTPPEFNMQVGFVVYKNGGEVVRHTHRLFERQITGTTEVLIVKTGRCEMDVFNDDRQLVATRELRVGDVLLLVGGGHGFRMLEDTVLLEIKQGPYTGLDEKERF